MGARIILAWLLACLSKWAIKKHDMTLVVTAGSSGTKLTGEYIGEMLSPECVVRKQLERPFWDFSIPLSILGFEDKQYSPIEWLFLIVRAVIRLIVGNRNQTWTIVQVSTYKKEIALYWSRILSPDVLVLTADAQTIGVLEQELTSSVRGIIIAQHEIKDHISPYCNRSSRVHTVGPEYDADVTIESVTEHDSGTTVTALIHASGTHKVFNAFQKGVYIRVPLILSIATLIALDYDVKEISDKVLQAQIEIDRFIFSAHA